MQLKSESLSGFKMMYIIVFSFLWYASTLGYSQDSIDVSRRAAAPLFSSYDPLNVTIKSDFKSLVKKKGKEPVYQQAELIYHSEGIDEIFRIEIRPRGITRRVNNWCSFPPLMINFKKKEVVNTIFEGQDKIKFVAYCRDTEANEQYNIQEYLVYRVYELLSPYSFKVRLVRITYLDTGGKYRPVVRYGFLIEDEDAMAARNGGKIVELQLNNHDRCDRQSIDVFTCFQYMVGNTDWGVSNQHNVKLVAIKGKLPIPVPYDFDITGVVNTNYASPDERLGIKSVRERLFRGYCRMPGEYEKILEVFEEKKTAIYDLYRSCELLNEKQLKEALAFYDQFYDIISDPRQIRSQFYDACPLIHSHLHQR